MKNVQDSNDNHSRCSDHSIQGKIEVSGSLQVPDSKLAIDQYHAEYDKSTGYKEHTKARETAAVKIAGWTLLVTTLYLIATILIFIQAKRSADAAENAATAAAKQFRNDQRPYVSAEVRSSFDELKSNDILLRNQDGSFTIGWRVFIKNGGRSPAQDILPSESETHICWSPCSEPEMEKKITGVFSSMETRFWQLFADWS